MTPTSPLTNPPMDPIQQADVSTIHKWLGNDQAVLIDVREPHEFDAMHIPGAIHIPLSQFDVNALPKGEGKHMVFYCAMGMRSQSVADQLIENNIIDTAVNMVGGIQAWSAAGYPLES